MLFARIIHSALLAAAFVLSSALFAKPAFFSSLIFTVAVALLAALTACLQP